MRTSFLFVLSALGLAVAQTPGTIENFQMTNNGEIFVDLEWDLVGGDLVIDKYTLLYDGDFSTDIKCPVAHCVHKVNYLNPCTVYDFTLTPHFEGGIDGDTVATQGNTLDLIPGPPLNPSATPNKNGILVTWERPSENANCVDKYQVCLREAGETATDCKMHGNNTIVLRDIQLCTDYIISISALTPVGTAGPDVTTLATTGTGVPGIPQNVVVTLATQDMIKISYDDPFENPNCVDEFGVIYGPLDKTFGQISPVLTGEHEHTISPLDPCTNYSIGVYGMNSNGDIGPTAINYAATEDAVPLPPSSVDVTPGGPDSIDVTWPGMPDNGCGETITICWNDQIHPEEQCQEIDGGGIIEGGGSFIIKDLLPCTSYEIVIVINSPSGMPSLPIGNFTFTDDVTPDPVENLRISSVSAHEMTVSYDAPSNLPQCIREYDTNVINLDQVYDTAKYFNMENHLTPRIDETHNELEACSNYRVEVRTVSRQGLESPWNSVDTVTGGDTPSEVRNLQEKSSTTNSVTLLWFQPATNPRCASAYLVEWAGGNETVVMSTSEFSIEYTITGLETCLPYTFSVTAQSTSSGDSAPATIDVTTQCS
ncbi:hypothetical protein SK128_007753 [Halocaridina rubra]|uniref:Fibronectin type-III domain-containing protein n=1 Tax=Halocaridina rubra TaxID=373956 RepID=A0AAN8WAY4_HALRR